MLVKELIAKNCIFKLYFKEEIELPLLYKKGEKYWWKLFCFIPLFKITAKKNIYDGGCCANRTFDMLVRYDYLNLKVFKFDYNKERITRKAHVTIKRFGSNDEQYEVFDTNKEAEEFFDKVTTSK